MQRPAHELIERYLYQVSKRLPQNLRDDVIQELRSLVLDSVEDRSGGAPNDDETVVEVLRQIGPPDQIAARYQAAGRSLIGPTLYPVFLRVAKYTSLALMGGIFVLLALSIAGTSVGGASAWNAALAAEWVWLLGASLVLSLGVLVLVFAVAERAMARKQTAGLTRRPSVFDPRSLPAAPVGDDSERISPGKLVTRIYLITAFFALLNFFPRWVGLYFASRIEREGEVLYTAGAVPLPVLGIHVPVALFDAWWLLAMALTLLVLRQGRWTAVTRWCEIAVRAVGALVLAVTLGASFYGSYDAAWMLAKYPEFEHAGPPLRVLILQILLWTLVATAIGAAVRAYREVRRASGGYYPMERHC